MLNPNTRLNQKGFLMIQFLQGGSSEYCYLDESFKVTISFEFYNLGIFFLELTIKGELNDSDVISHSNANHFGVLDEVFSNMIVCTEEYTATCDSFINQEIILMYILDHAFEIMGTTHGSWEIAIARKKVDLSNMSKAFIVSNCDESTTHFDLICLNSWNGEIDIYDIRLLLSEYVAQTTAKSLENQSQGD